MNDLLRPALYDAWHDVQPVRPRAARPRTWQIVGPVCESADFLARDRELALAEGDLLAILSAGGYAVVMSAKHNPRARAAGGVGDGQRMDFVRPRRRVGRMFRAESLTPSPAVR